MAIHAWRMTLRPAARLAVVPRTVRAYATQRTSKMSFVSKLFSDPVIETIVVASRIARILLGSVLVVGGTTLVAWEGMHQYVEYAAMQMTSTASPLMRTSMHGHSASIQTAGLVCLAGT